LLSAYNSSFRNLPYTREGIAFECEIEPVATGRNGEKEETIVSLQLVKSPADKTPATPPKPAS
jgi:hypothetical protein